MPGPHLFTPLTLRGLTLRNRVVLSPMCQYQAVEGRVQDWHYEHHSRFASGGFGLAFVEATGVMREGRITYGCTGFWSDEQVPGLARIVDLYHRYDTPCGIQIGHSGRRGSAERPWDGAAPITRIDGAEPAWRTVGPSPLPESPGKPVPHELTADEIEEVIEAFRRAAVRAQSAGFDVLEIHGAHGYLLHSFFSPISNRRSDAFGGSRQSRMRLPLLVAEALRKLWPEHKPLFYRTSSVDGVEGGLTIEDTVALARELKLRGVDVIDCSSGGMSGPATLSTVKIKPGYQVPYAEAVRNRASIATMTVGAIIEPKQAEAIVAEGKADLIALGRQVMAEPHWVLRAAQELGQPEPNHVLPIYYSFYLDRRAKVLDLSGHS